MVERLRKIMLNMAMHINFVVNDIKHVATLLEWNHQCHFVTLLNK